MQGGLEGFNHRQRLLDLARFDYELAIPRYGVRHDDCSALHVTIFRRLRAGCHVQSFETRERDLCGLKRIGELGS